MNIKIKQIATQAGMEDYPTYGVNTLYGDDEIEKFAKLLILECCKVIEPDDDPVDEINLRCSVIAQIHKHFDINVDD